MIFSLGKINLKYFIYIIPFIVIEIYSDYILYGYSKKIVENRLVGTFLTKFCLLLIIIPALISKKYNSSDSPKEKIEKEINNENVKNRSNNNSNDANNNNMKIKDIIIFFAVCILDLVLEFSYILIELLNGYNTEEYFIFESLIWLFFPKFIFKKNIL